MTISALGIAAAGKIFWWFQWSENFHVYHVAQNFIGIGLAALIPAFLVHNYEPSKKWLSISIVILASLLYHGNVNYFPVDPYGLVRILKNMLVYGDFGSIGVFLEIVLLPFFWLLLFNRIVKR